MARPVSFGRTVARWLPVGLVAALVLAEVVATVLDIVRGPYGTIHWEERINARQGLLMLCGHLEHTWDLQYQPFCGGCTAEAILAAGLFTVLEPTVHVFKLIPAGFHVALTLLGALLGWRAAGWRGAVAFLVLMAGLPALFRKLALTGWGNHAESGAFPFLAALLLVGGASPRRTWLRPGAAGLVTGLGAWFCYTTLHAIPALLALLAWRPGGGRRFLAFGTGALVGVLPWVGYALYDTRAVTTLERSSEAPWLPRPTEYLDWLAGADLVRALWLPLLGPAEVPALARFFWYGLWTLALVGLVLGLRHALRAGLLRPGGAPATPTDRALLYGPLALLGLLGAYALRSDFWRGALGAVDFFNLRYLSPVVPILMLCAAVTQGAAFPRGLRAVALVGILAVGATGTWLRSLEWGPVRKGQFGLSIIDDIVPRGPQLWQGDVEPLLAHLAADPDEPLICRQDHLFALGRLACDQEGNAPLAADLLPLTSTRTERRVFLEGCADHASTPFRSQQRCDLTRWPEVMGTLCADAGCAGRPGLEQEVAAALLRGTGPPCTNGAEEPPTGDQGATWLHGLCQVKGEDAVSRYLEAGLEPARDPALSQNLWRHAPECARHPAFAYGVGWAWARWVGCEEPLRFQARLPWVGAEGLEGHREGCERFRMQGQDALPSLMARREAPPPAPPAPAGPGAGPDMPPPPQATR